MRNLRLQIEYDGTKYCGWQVQSRRRQKSIQGTLEKALRKILQEKVKLIASGRTDAGVHAQAQVANFKTRSNIGTERLQLGLNALLPDDVAITKIKEVAAGFHSRFCASSKIYRYTILNRTYPSALLKNRVYFFPFPLDLRLMQQESKALLGRHNFSAFRTTSKNEKDPVKTIKRIKIFKTGSLVHIDLEANGFLYNMVRCIAGTLLEIGRAKLPKGSLKQILLRRKRKLAGPKVPACGLYLKQVKY